MTKFAYLFERFPSFGQTFCYREVAELARQGVNSPIFSVFIKQFMWDYACKKSGFVTFTHTSLEWPRALLSGSANSSQSLSALPPTPMIFLRREISRSVWTNLSMQRVQSLPRPITRQNSCASASQIARIKFIASTTDWIWRLSCARIFRRLHY